MTPKEPFRDRAAPWCDVPHSDRSPRFRFRLESSAPPTAADHLSSVRRCSSTLKSHTVGVLSFRNPIFLLPEFVI